MMNQMERVFGQPSWRIESPSVTAFVTELGGHLGPVTFRVDGREIQPYSVAPWHSEEIGDEHPPIIRVLRGDFFCMPFGLNGTPYYGEHYQLHGETANRLWKGEATGNALRATLDFEQRPGTVTKEISLRGDDLVLYTRHLVEGMSGPMNYGYHAMLKFDSPGLVSTSPFRIGEVFPERLEDPAIGGYASLKPGARFGALTDVPMASGETADLSRYPAREGFEDLVMLVSEADSGLAWTAASFPEEGYVWFCLKNAATLVSTMLWHSNGGRHYAPWNGRHRRVLGLEELTSYYHYGLAESVWPNPLQAEGVRTYAELSPEQPLDVRTIMGITPIPTEFSHVASIEPSGNGIVLLDTRGYAAPAELDLAFVI